MNTLSHQTEHSHAPKVGRLARMLGPLKITGIFWYRFHEFGIRVLPLWAMPIIVGVFSALFFVLLRNVRSAVAANLASASGPGSPSSWTATPSPMTSTMPLGTGCVQALSPSAIARTRYWAGASCGNATTHAKTRLGVESELPRER